MKRRKFSKCFVAMLLVIVMGITAVPMSVLTVMADGVKSVTEELKVENTYTPPNEIESTDLIDSSELENAYILDEKIEGRTFNSKEFIMSDGTILVQQFAQNIHYEDEEGLKEIDNTIVEVENENGETTYENSANFYKVKMNKNFKPNKEFLELKNGEYHLTFTFVDDSAKNATAKNDDKVKEKSNNKYKDKKLKNPKPYSTGEGKVSYTNIAKDVDLEYEAKDNGIKENIIVNNYLSDYDFDFKIKVKNLTLQENLDGSISAINEEGEEKYVIPAPFMFDANGEYNYEVEYVLTEAEDGYTLTISADKDWIETKAKLPVTINPTIKTFSGVEVKGVTFKNVYEKDSGKQLKSEMYVGEKESGNKSNAYVRFELPEKGETYTLLGATITYSHKTEGMSLLKNKSIKYSVNLVDSKQDLSSINVDKVPKRIETLGVKGASVNLASTEETNTLKINANNIKNEEALAFSFETEEQNSSGGYVSIYTTGERALYLTTQYIQNVGIDESYSMETAEIEGATAYVNKATGGLTVNLDVASVNNNSSLPLKASFIYNSNYNEVFTEYGMLNYLGNHFKLNYQQYIKNKTQTSLNLIDADGSVVVMNKSGTVYRSKDRLLTAEEDGGDIIIYDASLNTRRFRNGKLVEIYNMQSYLSNPENYERIEVNYWRTGEPEVETEMILNVAYYGSDEATASYEIAFMYSLGLLYGVNVKRSGVVLHGYSTEYEYLEESNTYNLIVARSQKANRNIFTMEYDAYEGYMEAVFDREGQGLCFLHEPYDDRIWSINSLMGSRTSNAKWYDCIEFDYDSTPSVTETSYIQDGKNVAKAYVCFDSSLVPVSEWMIDETGEVSGVNKGVFEKVGTTVYSNYNRISTSFVQKNVSNQSSISAGQTKRISINKGSDIVSKPYSKYGISFLVESQIEINLTVSDGTNTKSIVLGNGGTLYVVMECGYFSFKNFNFTNNSTTNSVNIKNLCYDYIGYCKETAKHMTSPSVRDVYAVTEIISYSRQGEYQKKNYDGKQRLTSEENATNLDPVLETTTYQYTEPAQGVLHDYWLGKPETIVTTRNEEEISRISYVYTRVSLNNVDYENTETIVSKGNDYKKRTQEKVEKNTNGYVITKTDENNVQTVQTYAVLDADIRLKSVERESVKEEYRYSFFGDVKQIRVLKKDEETDEWVELSKSDSTYYGAFCYNHSYAGQTFSYTYDDYWHTTAISHGDQVMLSYEYDGDNFNGYLDDLTKKTYANGQYETYNYNGNSYTVNYGGSSIADQYVYNYDNANRITSSVYNKNGVQQLSYNYGDLNNKTQSVLTTTGLSYNAQFTINKDSLYNRVNSTVDKFTINNANTIFTNNYAYNSKNLLTSNTIGSYNSNITYDAFDRLNRYVAKNGNIDVVDQEYFYKGYAVNGVNYTTDMLYYIQDNNDINHDISNEYDNKGYITTVRYNNKTTNYTYDELGRLKTEMSNNTQVTYEYNSYNAITSVSGGELATTYTYGDFGRLSSITQQGETLYFTYDAMGNPTTYKGSSSSAPANMTWTQGRKLASGTLNGNAFAYQYDMNGMRYKKTVNGNVTEYYLDGSTIIAENRIVGTTNNLIYYIYDSMGLSGMVYNGQNYYYVKNTLGDIIGIRNSSGTTVATYTYDAWGNILSMSGDMAEVNPFRYRGYYYDTESGFYYLQTRYYDPTIRQFINADNYELLPILSQTIGQLNLYAYVNNNPIMFTDETGEWVETVFDLLSLGVSIVEVVINPLDPLAWAGLAGDAFDLIPFVTGVGESVRGVKVVKKGISALDDTYDSIRMAKAINYASEFTDEGLDLIRAVDRTADGFTSSSHLLGTKIHSSFMKGYTIPRTRLRVDGLAGNTIFELKPYNRRSLRAGVKQLIQYNKAYTGSPKMFLLFY